MSDTLLRSALAEEAKLEDELRQLEAYQKLQAIRQLIALYMNGPGATASQSRDVTATRAARPVVRHRGQVASVVAGAEDYFRRMGRRAQTQEILDMLKDAGHDFTSSNPLGSLSSALSHSPLFNNKRGLGYGLAEWGDADGAMHNPEALANQRSPLQDAMAHLHSVAEPVSTEEGV